MPRLSATFNGDFNKAFLSHLIRVASHVKERLPNARIIIWDDMLHNMDEAELISFKPQIQKLGIEPMIWAYVEKVNEWFQSYLYVKYGRIFEKVWAASAYKGASGELTTVTSIKHHYLNHISWIQVIKEKHIMGVVQFRGIALTGWSRYDHFLALCDLLPQAIPSLIYNLETMRLGRLDEEKKRNISEQLGCNSYIPWDLNEIYGGQISCTFPGHEVYEIVLTLPAILSQLNQSLDFAKKYILPFSLLHDYLNMRRAEEVLDKLVYDYRQLVGFERRFIKACDKMYWNDTAIEWLQVYVRPHLDPLYDQIVGIKRSMKINHWAPRPLPIKLKQLPEFI